MGACSAVAVTIGMDYFMADTLGGTWPDAIAKDLNNWFSASLSNTSPAVYAVFAAVVLVLGAFGAFMGAVFAMFFIKFLGMLVREDEQA